MRYIMVLLTFIMLITGTVYSQQPDFSDFSDWLGHCDVSQSQDIEEMIADCEATRIDLITLDPVEAYYKCHLLLVGELPEDTDILLDDVINKSKDAPTACSELLALANLDSNDVVANTIQGQTGAYADFNIKSVKILQRMHNFHRSLFPNKGPALGMITGTPYNTGVEFIYDTYSSGAYYFDRAFFNTDVHISDTLLNPNYLRPVRVQTDPDSHTRDPVSTRGYTHPTKTYAVNYASPTKSDPNWYDILQLGSHAFMPRGLLVGVEAAQPLIIPLLTGNTIQTNFSTIDLFKNHGSGWIGSNDFLVNSLSQTDKTRANGGTNAARATANWLYGEMLGLRVPMLRQSDVLNFVQISAATGPGQPPFRNSSNCMSCHAASDPLACTFRNHEVKGLTKASNGEIAGVNQISTLYIREIQPTNGKWPITEDIRAVSPNKHFFRYDPDGLLFFRDYNGQLIEKHFTGIDGLAQALSTTEQYYIAMANHYMKFITGYNANIQDPGHDMAIAMNSEEQALKEFVVTQGLLLKQNGNPQEIIHNIFASPYFMRNDGGF